MPDQFSIADTLALLQIVAIVFSAAWAISLFKRSQEIQKEIQVLRKARLYKDMEFKAIDVFKMAIDEPVLNELYATAEKQDPALTDRDKSKIRDYAHCVLNLFELIYNLQARSLLTEGIFATWVPWYFEFSQGKLARDLWNEEAEEHFTSEFAMALGEVFKVDTPRLAFDVFAKRGLIQVRRS